MMVKAKLFFEFYFMKKNEHSRSYVIFFHKIKTKKNKSWGVFLCLT